ncbi:MAG: 7-cyano-7-deazaguanine synthase QueC [Rhodospirillaceae bacterium]|nr:7-cyano-7-deazaguanine synthase QueC [Rhodospirillaceae bacterium]
MRETRIGLVLLAGGLDSPNAAAWALDKGMKVSAVSFDYGQTHRQELDAATAIASRLGLSHSIVDVSFYRDLAAHSSLTQPQNLVMPSDRSAAEMADGIPPTYVPLRNTFFLTMAAAWLESKALAEIEINGVDASNLEATLVIAANAIDYSGYPDCRPEFYTAITESLRLGSKLGTQYGVPFTIATPLIDKSKADIVRLAGRLNAPIDETWSCYVAGESPCGHCDSCLLRARGFAEAGIDDPALIST